MKNAVPLERYCTCVELWKGCILAGIFAMSTSIFDLMWSVGHMISENDQTFFYLLFGLGIESVLFIAATGLLFTALVKKSKYLLLPWLLLACIDIIYSLVLAFAELILPNSYTASCALNVVTTLVSILVCTIMLYCVLIVFVQYMTYANCNPGNTEIKVTPAKDDSMRNITGSVNRNFHEAGGSSGNYATEENSLKVPQVSTPKDAW